MTLLVAWTGIDSRSPASVYIATDSRVSWGGGSYFDNSIKTFALTQFPAVIGYCGDSLSSQMLIAQTISVVETYTPHTDLTIELITEIIVRTINRNYNNYPTEKTTGNFTIVVCGKKQLSSTGDFECYRIKSNFDNTEKQKVDFPEVSGPLVIAGSGEKEFREQFERTQTSANPNKSTSRNVFHAFYETISGSNNSTIGAIPQLVHVYRKPNTSGSHNGMVIKGSLYLAGQKTDRDLLPDHIQWFNENFEKANPRTKSRLFGAQRQTPYRG